MVVGMDLYAEIRQSYLSGESQRSIAQRLEISRQSVKKYCEGKTMPGVRRIYSRAPTVATDDVTAFIRECTEADKTENLKKQTHSAKRIYDRLVEEKQFTGSYSAVRRMVHELKAAYVPPQADMPLEYDPGDAIQIDWGEATAYLDGVRTTVQLFCGRLCYEPIDLCSCYYPKMVPPLDFLEECRRYWARRENLFSGTIERKIGNICYVVSTECGGTESLAHKVKRLIFSGKEALC